MKEGFLVESLISAIFYQPVSFSYASFGSIALAGAFQHFLRNSKTSQGPPGLA